MNYKMKYLPLLIFCTTLLLPSFLFAAEPAAESWQLHGRSETMLEWHDINGKSDGNLDEGTHWRQELSLNLSKKLSKGRTGLDFRGRATNNKQVDNRDARLLMLHGYWQQGRINFEFGDVAGSYNPLVLSTSAKGLKLGYRTGTRDSGVEYTVIGGIQKASWEELYDHTADKSVDRYVTGFNSVWTHAPAQSIGATFSFIKDDSATTDNSGTGVTTTGAAEAKTVGMDWKWRFNRYIDFKGETAMTHADQDTKDGQSAQDAWGLKLRLLTKPLPRSVRSNFMYERLDPDYKPVIASASSDRERIENDTEWMINRQLRLRTTLKYSHDNLDDQLTDTLTTREGVLYFTYRPDWLKRSDMGLRAQFKTDKGRGSDRYTQVDELNFNFRPRSGWRYGAAWIYTDINDDSSSGEDQSINTLRGTVGWKKRLHEENLIRVTVQMDGNFINRDSGDRESLGGRLDFGYDAGNLWSTDLSAGTKSSFSDTTADNSYINYQFRANYHPGSDRSKAIRLTAERREYDSDDVASPDYQEHIVKLAYLFSF